MGPLSPDRAFTERAQERPLHLVTLMQPRNSGLMDAQFVRRGTLRASTL